MLAKWYHPGSKLVPLTAVTGDQHLIWYTVPFGSYDLARTIYEITIRVYIFIYMDVQNPVCPFRSRPSPPPSFERNDRGRRVGKLVFRCLEWPPRKYRMLAHVISRNSLSLALGVPLLGCTRGAAPDADPGELVHLFPYSPATPIPYPDVVHSLDSKTKKSFVICFVVLFFSDTATLYCLYFELHSHYRFQRRGREIFPHFGQIHPSKLLQWLCRPVFLRHSYSLPFIFRTA